MNFSAHFLGAAAAGIGAGFCSLTVTTSLKSAGVATAVGCCGGLFPDLDTASIPARWFGRIGFLIAGTAFGLGNWTHSMIFMIISSLIGLFALLLLSLKHRGPFHKYWLPAFFIALAIWGRFPEPFINILCGCFAAGIITHLVIDLIFPWQVKGWF